MNILIWRRTIIFIKEYLLILGIFIIFISSAMVSVNMAMSVQYTVYFMLFMLLYVLLSSDISWHRVLISFSLFFWLFHAVITIISPLIPGIYKGFILLFYTPKNANIILYQYSIQTYAGIAGQTGTNSFYLSIGIGLVVSLIFEKKKRVSFHIIVFLGLLVFALFLTGKRGMLVGNILAIILMVIVRNQKNTIKNIIKPIKLTFIIIGFLFISSKFIPYLKKTLERFVSVGEISSGRLGLYSDAINLINRGKLWGYGIHTYSKLDITGIETSMGTHNDFLQFIVEIGFLGSFIFFLPVFSLLAYTIKLTRKLYSTQIVCITNESKRAILTSLYVQVLMIFYSLIGNPFNYYNTLFIYILFSSIPIGLKIIITTNRIAYVR